MKIQQLDLLGRGSPKKPIRRSLNMYPSRGPAIDVQRKLRSRLSCDGLIKAPRPISLPRQKFTYCPKQDPGVFGDKGRFLAICKPAGTRKSVSNGRWPAIYVVWRLSRVYGDLFAKDTRRPFGSSGCIVDVPPYSSINCSKQFTNIVMTQDRNPMEVTVTKKSRKLNSLYQIKVTLVGSKPPIWRRLIVKDNIRLDQLHTVLQVAMGWFDCHLHQYRVGGSYIGIPNPDFDFDVTDERKVCLQDIISNPKDNFVYEYDFGDGWEHKIVLEKILPLDFSDSPIIIKGKKACPPEDCGGIWGYSDFLDAIQDPKHGEHESMLEWVGGEFDPDEFNMVDINKKLKTLKL